MGEERNEKRTERKPGRERATGREKSRLTFSDPSKVNSVAMETAMRFCRRDGKQVSDESGREGRGELKWSRTNLVGVDQRVGNGDNGGEVDGERDGGNGLDGRKELVDEGLLVDVEHLRTEDGSVVEDLDDGHSVREGGDLKRVETKMIRSETIRSITASSGHERRAEC
jgi:hypothetical protein